jgi:3-(3-hydroxy-phenyl)propionate hydroxylase
VGRYVYPRFSYRPTPDATAAHPPEHETVVVGAGPVGLTFALDLAARGRPVLLVDEDDTVSIGSRAICWSKRTLEIMDRLGLGERLLQKGVTWNTGRVFFRDREVYHFNLLPEPGHRMPAFVNLQQYWFEQFAVEAVEAQPQIEVRWKTRVQAIEPRNDGVLISLDSPEGPYRIHAQYLIACDGAKSAIRRMLGLDFRGKVFEDRFLITDVHMQANFPAERWFWFEPPFHSGHSALLHRQADDIWRIDLQLGPDADPELEKRPDRVVPRLRAMLGEDRPFEIEWVSVYTFQCRRLERFRHGRVIFCGDSAHQVSPFGARGGNGGIQDADNLAWKLALVLAGTAPESLLESYDFERGLAADENIQNSTRSTDFIAPRGPAAIAFRDAVLGLAAQFDFARRFVNSGRLSVPAVYDGSSLSAHDEPTFAALMRPGSPAVDAPVEVDGRPSWLLHQIGPGFTLLLAAGGDSRREDLAAAVADLPVPVTIRTVGLGHDADLYDRDGLVTQRYALSPGTAYLFRPDQHVAARWRSPRPEAVRAAVLRAIGR